MRRGILLVVLLGVTSRAWSQAPEVTVNLLLKEKRPHMLASGVAVADCYNNSLPGSQREEIALIKVTIPGPLGRSAAHLAADKAGELGANCLLVVSSFGTDNAQYPVERSYRAFRITVPYGPWRVPAAPASIASAATVRSAAPATPVFPMAKLKAPVIEKKPDGHGDHLSRAMGEAVYDHEIVLDPARADPETWADVVQDVREYFGEAEAEKLARLVEAGKAVRIDLREGKVSGL